MPNIHEGKHPIFADLHAKPRSQGTTVEIAFAVEPNPEGLEVIVGDDGSLSMKESGNYSSGSGGVISKWFQLNIGRQKTANEVKEAMDIAAPYLASKDQDGKLHFLYWACGPEGKDIEVIGDLTAEEAAAYPFPGPQQFGRGTYLVPALRHQVSYVREKMQSGQAPKSNIGLYFTDGQIHDMPEVTRWTRDLAQAITDAKFPPTTVILIGVGPDVDHEQMEALEEIELPGYEGREIWCCAECESMDDLPELAAHLLDENVPAFWGGATFIDEHGNTVRSFEDMVPAVVELELPAGATSFTLRVANDEIAQSLEGMEHD